MLAARPEAQPGGSFGEFADERCREDLAAAGERGDPGGDDHVTTEQVVLLIEGLPGVQPDPDADRGLDVHDGTLDGDGTRQRPARLAEGHHERITRGFYLPSAMERDLFAHHAVVLSEQLHERLVAQTVQKEG